MTRPDVTTRPLLSVAVPCFNEEAVIRQTHERLVGVLSRLEVRFEILYVDDGSQDGTLAALRSIQLADPCVRVLGLSRNFGHQTAVTAGIDAAGGDAVVLIDADLQDPPEVIEEMLGRWREGFHIAFGKRLDRPGETPFKLATANLFYRLIDRLSDTPIPRDTGDFRLIDRRVVEALRGMPERDRFLRGMVAWVGFRAVAVPYTRAPRAAGQSKYPVLKMVRFALDGIVSFSLVPLRLATAGGFLASVLAMLGILYALVLRLFTGIWVPGWTLLFIGMMFLGGAQLITTGIIGEYVGRTYRETKRRPLYLVEHRLGFDPPGTASGSASRDTPDEGRA